MATVKDFLDRLVTYGENNGHNGKMYFTKMKIKDVPKSCCTSSQTEVYDFDDTKTLIAQKHQLLEPKSCDALRIVPQEEIIYFIEFKGWKDFITWQLKPTVNAEEAIKKQIQKFNLPVKLSDSLLVLDNLIQDKSFIVTAAEKRLYLATPKKMILLVDISPQANPLQNIALSLGFLSLFSSKPEVIIKKYLDEELKNLPLSSMKNTEKSIILDCTSVDSFFN